MKLRPYPVSLNGNILESDQFGFVVVKGGEPQAIVFRCRGPNRPPNGMQCLVNIVRGDPDLIAHRHGWDGNRDEPTITPSIGCDSHPRRCGWHGNIIKGEITP